MAILDIEPAKQQKTKKEETVAVHEPNIYGFRTENRSTQTRFHFHMEKCVGCHACEVACAEQNGLPVDTLWRRVGEVETGTFPDTQNLFLSSGCNHCLDAACMKGCPVDAYQVNERGIVLHLDDVCIGCQYCTWNCPYGVPVYQEDRNIVTKCDMCTNRLDQGLDPACVQACPADAIEIEEVALQTVVDTYLKVGVGPDMPDPEITMPSTRITVPEGIDLNDLKKVDRHYVEPEDPHTPLIWMTILTQFGFGGVVAVFLADLIRVFFNLPVVEAQTLGWLAPFMMAITGVSLGASTLHLGRPFYAYRAMKNWRTSWLSREVIGLSAFAGAAKMYSVFLLVTDGLMLVSVDDLGGEWVRVLLGGATVVSGVGGIYCSSMLYRVPARPAWDVRKTTVDFFLVAIIMGPAAFAVAVATSVMFGGGKGDYLTLCVQVAAWVSGVALIVKGGLHSNFLQRWQNSDVFELASCAGLYYEHYLKVRILRNSIGLLALGALASIACGVSLPGQSAFTVAALLALVGTLSFCWVNRYLFFVTVVPRNIPGNFHTADR